MTKTEHIVMWVGMCIMAAVGGVTWAEGDVFGAVLMTSLALCFLYLSVGSIGKEDS